MLDRHAVQELVRAGVTARVIAKQFGVSVRTVRRILRGGRCVAFRFQRRARIVQGKAGIALRRFRGLVRPGGMAASG